MGCGNTGISHALGFDVRVYGRVALESRVYEIQWEVVERSCALGKEGTRGRKEGRYSWMTLNEA